MCMYIRTILSFWSVHLITSGVHSEIYKLQI